MDRELRRAYIHNIKTTGWSDWHINNGIDKFPINTLHIDPNMQLLPGSEDKGFFRESPEDVQKNMTTCDGLVSNAVPCIIADQRA